MIPFDQWILEKRQAIQKRLNIRKTSFSRAAAWWPSQLARWPLDQKRYEALQRDIHQWSMDIPRRRMPKIRGMDQIQGFQQALRAGTVPAELPVLEAQTPSGETVASWWETVSPARLRPIQDQIWLEIVALNMQDHGDDLATLAREPIITTENGRIIDGHHRWATLRLFAPATSLTTLRVALGAKDLVPRALWFGRQHGNTQSR